MTTLAAIAESRQVHLQTLPRFREDIQWSRYMDDSDQRWVARDPISLEYYYFSHQEKRLTELLDGQASPAEILRAIQLQFPAANISAHWMQVVLRKLDNACLLLTDRSAYDLLHRKQRQSVRSAFAWLISPLSIRFPLADPTRMLCWLENPARWLFHRYAVAAVFSLTLMVGVLVLIRLAGSVSLADSLVQLLQGERLFWLIACYVCVKSLHELGHALACQIVGAECHDVGILLLCFTPCLYCDVSDTWKIPNRLKRAAVAAAGIYVELMLAMLAGVVWLSSQPGTLNTLALNVMVICSVGTLLVNANPLLKYDGYYVLSDVWGVPNLMHQSQEVIRASTVAWLSGTRMESKRWDAGPIGLALFGIASTLYRTLMLAALVWVVYVLSRRYDAQWLGVALVVVMLVGWFWVGWQSIITILQGLLVQGVRLRRLSMLVIVMGGLLWSLFMIPWPTYVRARGVGRFANMEPVFAAQAATITFAEQADSRVTAGAPVLILENFDARANLIRLRADLAQNQERVDDLQARSVDDSLAAQLLPTAMMSLQELKSKQAAMQRDLESLEVRATTDGVVVPSSWQLPVSLTSHPVDISRRWSISAECLGGGLERGELVAWVAHEQGGYCVEVMVQEQESDLLHVGALVQCRWDCAAWQQVNGKVKSISSEPISKTPEELQGDYELISIRDGNGTIVPERPSYLVTVEVDQIPDGASHGSLVTARIEVASRTLYQSSVRLFQQTFRSAKLSDAMRPTTP